MFLGKFIMNIYNLVLSFILMLSNWLFFSTYFNILTVVTYKSGNFNTKLLIFYNLFGLIIYTFTYGISTIFFEFNSIKNFDLIPFIFINIFLFSIFLFFSIILFLFEKIRYIHLVIIVFFSIVIISFIYPLLLSLAYDKYE